MEYATKIGIMMIIERIYIRVPYFQTNPYYDEVMKLVEVRSKKTLK